MDNIQKKHGGARIGAGRPKIENPKRTKTIRVPIEVAEYMKFLAKNYNLPLYNMIIQDGISTIESIQYELYKYDKLIINNIEDHFLVKVSGHHMKESGILHDDILLVKRNKKLHHGNIVIVANNNKTVIKKIHKQDNKIRLISDNKNCLDIDVNDDSLSQIWGVVTRVIRDYNS